MGEYEVTADHVPIVAELKAGLLTIKHSDGADEKYFVPGGFSLTHEGSTTVSFYMVKVPWLWLVLIALVGWMGKLNTFRVFLRAIAMRGEGGSPPCCAYNISYLPSHIN